MSLDLENLAPAPDIDSFDPTKMDRGDAVVTEEKVEEKVEDKVEDIFEEKAEEPEEEVEEPEEKAEEPEEEQPRDEKGKFASKGIPKARFDEAVGKEREAREAAERRAAELERRLNEAAQSKVQNEKIEEIEASIEKMETKHAELLLDGNVTEAAKVMKEIRMAERQIARAEATAEATQLTAQALEAERFDAAVARLEADYPALNPESESYDADLVELVLAKQRTLMSQQGLSPSNALSKAANQVAERFLKAEEPKADEKGLAAAKAQEDRKTQQIKKNLETQRKQPTSMKESGMDSDKAGQTGLPDVSMMTQEEFAALPASTIAKLRGDLV